MTTIVLGSAISACVPSTAALEILDAGYPDALKRAMELDAMHARNRSHPGRNPSTGVHRLTEIVLRGR